MNLILLTLRQAYYDMRAWRRNPAAVFFTLIFPLMFLVIFNVVFGDENIEVAPGQFVDTSTFYVPAILALSVINACYTNLAMSITFARDRGVLKRIRGTPLPSIAFLVGRILQSTAAMVLLVVLVLAFGVGLYGVDFPEDRLADFSVVLLVGAASYCALGLAITAIIPNTDAAPAVVNASVLPLLFISNVFIPTSNAPGWITDLASVFPVIHLASSLHSIFDPLGTATTDLTKDMAIIAGWGIAGIVLAVRFFSWEPKK